MNINEKFVNINEKFVYISVPVNDENKGPLFLFNLYIITIQKDTNLDFKIIT